MSTRTGLSDHRGDREMRVHPAAASSLQSESGAAMRRGLSAEPGLPAGGDQHLHLRQHPRAVRNEFGTAVRRVLSARTAVSGRSSRRAMRLQATARAVRQRAGAGL